MPQINAATVRLLNRLGADVVIPPGLGCCGAHASHGPRARRAATCRHQHRHLAQGEREAPLDAIVANASGCGTMLKTYDHLLRRMPQATRLRPCRASPSISASSLCVWVIAGGAAASGVAYPACSLQHGQKVTREPVALLEAAGFEVVTVPEGHLSAARRHQQLQPPSATRARPQDSQYREHAAGRDRVRQYRLHHPDRLWHHDPIVHTVELLDWASGRRRRSETGRQADRDSNCAFPTVLTCHAFLLHHDGPEIIDVGERRPGHHQVAEAREEPGESLL